MLCRKEDSIWTKREEMQVRDIAEALARLNIQNAEIIGNQRMPGPSERRGGGFSPLHLKLLQESDFLPEFSDLIREINRSICAGRTGGTEESDVSEKERKVSKVFRNASVVREEAASSGNFFRRACQRNCSECFWKSAAKILFPDLSV